MIAVGADDHEFYPCIELLGDGTTAAIMGQILTITDFICPSLDLLARQAATKVLPGVELGELDM